ncbi:hypothetical protein B0H66DRAFT_253923 [Apodospora peruviana]|uniref:C2H2-type domain-containing protein n=1 Tax=Apodospora peruviana TaxID=516989 RepID=A0AAE0M4I8_9PEZI|nr:hypothetical protein B0H66DRAFT_253923 [Apodospora peruviana]
MSRRMESRGRGSDPVSSRVAQKLANDAVISIPLRPRSRPIAGGTHANIMYSRKSAEPIRTVVATLHVATQHDDDCHHGPNPSADALSLSGTTPPSSPKASAFKTDDMPDAPPLKTDLGRQHHLESGDVPKKVAPTTDLPFRRHNRGIGSIDSILSSTTCVNTHSECSRADSRLSHCSPPDADDDSHESHETRRDAQHQHQYPTRERTIPHHLGGFHSISPATPRASNAFPSSNSYDDIDCEEGYDEELRQLVDEISSCVLRSTLGKDVDDCPAPLLILDCTTRYLEELQSAAQTGKLGVVLATGDQGDSFSPGDGSRHSDGGDQNDSGYGSGKGKRKAEGGSEDGLGGRDSGEEKQGEPSMAAHASNGRYTGNFNFSCPYRKRNPLRFNVRDYYVCATHSFTDMSQLKKHIRAHHPPVQRSAGLFLCPRCCQGFPLKDDLDRHLRQAVVCPLADDQGGTNPEDGITQKIISSLEARSVKAKIDNWDSLWKLLFPSDREIPEPAFIPVMEIFDFVAESRKFLLKLKDLLELQYRYILDDSSQSADMEVKIRQGLERSTQSLYTWIETVVQDWEQRVAGTSGAASFFANLVATQQIAAENWAATSQAFPPSPALTPTVSATGTVGTTVTSGDSPDPMASGGSAVAARQYRLPQKRAKRANASTPAPAPAPAPTPASASAKVQPATQIPVPSQAASRTPSIGRASLGSSVRRTRPVLPSQPVPILQNAPSQDPISPYQTTTWESIPVSSPYGIPFTNPAFFQPPTPGETGQYPIVTTHSQTVPTYLPSEPNGPIEFERRQSAARTSRLMSSGTPRSSINSTWMRDENRDSSQTLVEAHVPGRCQNMFCPSCNKTMPDADDVVVQKHQPMVTQELKASPMYHQHQHDHHLMEAGADMPLSATDPTFQWSPFQHGHGVHYDGTPGGGHVYD